MPRLCRIPVAPDAAGVAADVACNGDASPCSAVGTAEVSCDSTACVFAADVPLAWATAAACPASPPGLVVGAGGVNGVSVVACADAPA
jgi:hypothetical protein